MRACEAANRLAREERAPCGVSLVQPDHFLDSPVAERHFFGRHRAVDSEVSPIAVAMATETVAPSVAGALVQAKYLVARLTERAMKTRKAAPA